MYNSGADNNEKPKQGTPFLDEECNGFKQVINKGGILTADGYNVYLFGKARAKDCPLFQATFLKMQHGGGLGFVDSKLKNSSYIANDLNVITYRSDGTCRTGIVTKEKVGLGYSAYERVSVTADVKFGRVTWRVGQEIRHEVNYDLLKNEEIEWVPYIRLCDKGDNKPCKSYQRGFFLLNIRLPSNSDFSINFRDFKAPLSQHVYICSFAFAIHNS